eukprot:5176915-Amphidinium_carterae.1
MQEVCRRPSTTLKCLIARPPSWHFHAAQLPGNFSARCVSNKAKCAGVKIEYVPLIHREECAKC